MVVLLLLLQLLLYNGSVVVMVVLLLLLLHISVVLMVRLLTSGSVVVMMVVLLIWLLHISAVLMLRLQLFLHMLMMLLLLLLLIIVKPLTLRRHRSENVDRLDVFATIDHTRTKSSSMRAFAAATATSRVQALATALVHVFARALAIVFFAFAPSRRQLLHHLRVVLAKHSECVSQSCELHDFAAANLAPPLALHRCLRWCLRCRCRDKLNFGIFATAKANVI